MSFSWGPSFQFLSLFRKFLPFTPLYHLTQFIILTVLIIWIDKLEIYFLIFKYSMPYTTVLHALCFQQLGLFNHLCVMPWVCVKHFAVSKPALLVFNIGVQNSAESYHDFAPLGLDFHFVLLRTRAYPPFCCLACSFSPEWRWVEWEVWDSA